MARNLGSSLLRAANQLARESARQNRERERAYYRNLKEIERQRVLSEKQRIKDYYGSRVEQVSDLNSELEKSRQELNEILVSAIDKDLTISFDSMKIKANEIRINYGDSTVVAEKPIYIELEWLFLLKLFLWIAPIKRWYENIVSLSNLKFKEKMDDWQKIESKRIERIKKIEFDHAVTLDDEMKRVSEHNNLITDWENSYEEGEPDAICEYYKFLLGDSRYPDNFPQNIKVAYSSESRLLAIEIDLPEAEKVIPKEKAYKYIKSTDSISAPYITDKIFRESYSNLIAQVALRTLYEAFIGIKNKHIDTVALNCKIQTIDPATGRGVYPCLLSIRTTYTKMASIDLKHVDPALCLKELKATVSSSPSELLAVRPIVEFDMNDPRYIVEKDILSGLDARPNLMDLDPSEFESLITNLFQSMGLETKLTQASRDGGVDCVAYDPRPILGGKVVIQAKRYKNTVGVSSVRDLFGTLQNEGASKGILVTTSGYGKASYDFANGKPIELLDGSNLLFLLKEHADIDARIIMPLD